MNDLALRAREIGSTLALLAGAARDPVDELALYQALQSQSRALDRLADDMAKATANYRGE